MTNTLVIGACGQIGTELLLALRKGNGESNVWAADLKESCPENISNGPYCMLDIMDAEAVRQFIIEQNIKTVYLLAALLSATAEKNPSYAWDLNMQGLFTILDLAKEKHIEKIFWPSSIAVFGPTTPRNHTPQHTIMEPSTVYGISKQAGEQWCAYYHKRYGVDVRSIRYPGLISHASLPGGGTTDYAVEIFYHAKKSGAYKCFLRADSALPMMYMDDAIRATLELMDAPSEALSVRTAYNLSGCSFTPEQLVSAIQRKIPSFQATYEPDFRQPIADSWPASIDDTVAQSDWGWTAQYDVNEIVEVMLTNVDPCKI